MNAYEHFVATLIQNIQDSGRDISNLSSGGKNKITGASGHRHQIDVSFLDSSCPMPTLVLIECKHPHNPKKRIDNPVVKVLYATMRDIRDHTETPSNVLGIIMSSVPFRSGAKTLARHWSILLHKVSPDPPYNFRYEDIIQVALADHLGMTDRVEVKKAEPDH